MEKRNVFEIEELKCAYPNRPDRMVLYVKHLVIPQGKVVYLVGPSGIGKSTILEALGMMNKTVMPGCGKFLYKGEDMSTWWEQDDEKMSAFRRKEFSFIFQSNNLMKNFNAWENVKSTALFQGMSNSKAEKMKEKIFAAVDIKPEKWGMPVSDLSGGQRQRLAFARAIMPSFSVLFGDEPTGNLDPATADKMMGRLRHILDDKDEATAIIVSHDMTLATRYADRIVRFHKCRLETEKSDDDDELVYGLIDEQSIYARSGERWQNHDGSCQYSCEELAHHLSQTINA